MCIVATLSSFYITPEMSIFIGKNSTNFKRALAVAGASAPLAGHALCVCVFLSAPSLMRYENPNRTETSVRELCSKDSLQDSWADSFADSFHESLEGSLKRSACALNSLRRRCATLAKASNSFSS